MVRRYAVSIQLGRSCKGMRGLWQLSPKLQLPGSGRCFLCCNVPRNSRRQTHLSHSEQARCSHHWHFRRRLTWFLRKATASLLEHRLVCHFVRFGDSCWLATPWTGDRAATLRKNHVVRRSSWCKAMNYQAGLLVRLVDRRIYCVGTRLDGKSAAVLRFMLTARKYGIKDIQVVHCSHE